MIATFTDSQPWCLARRHDGWGICTRRRRHTGPHAASSMLRGPHIMWTTS